MVVRWPVVMSSAMALCLAAGLHAQSPQVQGGPKLRDPFEAATEFSAIMNGSLSGPASQWKVYRAGSQMRADLPKGYMVTDLNERSHFTFYPEGGYCYQGPIPAAQAFPFFLLKDAKVDVTALGTETLDGHPCDVEDVTITPPGRPELKLKVWSARDLKGFPIKMQRDVAGKTLTESFKDIHLGPQDPALFKKPEGCVSRPAPGMQGTQTIGSQPREPAPKSTEKPQPH